MLVLVVPPNKVLKGFRFLTPDDVPVENLVLTCEGKTFGKLTSMAFSPGWGRTIALGFVRAAQAEVGTEFLCERAGGGAGEGEPRSIVVYDLPMLLPSQGGT
ncbi:glycine cleavage T C-terminal barrel domain-containing protein [Singulisphaera sp. Ch08]|uniref:Glycine cleavage T C-terminal barrel domain-containing protein n=1 Tax=Singulisphaera sp. Ch08 TaxID=3120278 RepID=A0AAU7CNR3_9BACT